MQLAEPDSVARESESLLAASESTRESVTVASVTPEAKPTPDPERPTTLFGDDPRVFRYKILEKQLHEMLAQKGIEQQGTAGLVSIKAIAVILDGMGRGVEEPVGVPFVLSKASDPKDQRVFSLNGKSYRFRNWEFPEFDEFNTFGQTCTTATGYQLTPDLLARIESRTQEALAVMRPAYEQGIQAATK